MLPDIEIINSKQGRFICFKTEDLITKSLRVNGTWAEFEINLAKMFSKGVDAPTVVDIGANLGAFTVPIAKQLEQWGGCVYSYEPQRIIFQQLCANVYINRLDNVYAMNVGLGNQCEKIKLPKVDYWSTRNIGSVSLLEDIRGVTKVEYSKKETEEISINMLNNLRITGVCTFVKIDVEGFELQVLQGGSEFLENNNYPPILFEEWRANKFSGDVNVSIQQRQRAVRSVLQRMGYVISDFDFGNEKLAQHPKNITRVNVVKDGNTLRFIRER